MQTSLPLILTILGKICLRSRLNAVTAVSQINGIQIGGDNFFFGELFFQYYGVISFLNLTSHVVVELLKIYSILSESTVIYDDEGNEIDTVFSEQNRTNVEYKDLPQDLIDAVVALEDKNRINRFQLSLCFFFFLLFFR